MSIILKYSIKAILFGVDETVVNNLDIGNSYIIEKDSLINNDLYDEFDYTVFGIRRIYESAKINNELNVAVLRKTEEFEYTNVELKVGEGRFVDNKNINDIIFDYENSEMEYVDKKMRTIRLYSENCFNIKELLINTQVVESDDNNQELLYYYNSKIPFPDKVIGNIDKLSLNSQDEIDRINTFVTKTDLDFKGYRFSPELLSSAAFLYDQSYTSPVVTLRFMVCVIGLESLLVNGNTELSYRFKRNGAMLLSSNSNEYYKLLPKMKRIYNIRSKYVHNGIIDSLDEKEVIEARKLLRDVIFKIVDLNIPQEQLLKELDLKGY